MQTAAQQTTEQLSDPLPFSLAGFTFELVARDRITLPEYKGATLRGAFGHALRKIYCQRPFGRLCEKCQYPTECGYSYIFETPKAFGKTTDFTATNLPHPFVLVPPITPQRDYLPGETFQVSLTLFGAAISLTEQFITAVQIIGENGIGRGRGRFEIASVGNLDGSLVYSQENPQQPGQVFVAEYKNFIAEKTEDCAALTVEFLTPTCLLQHGRAMEEIPFDLLIRSLLRRASLLADVHCGQKWQLDFRALIDRASENVRGAAGGGRETGGEKRGASGEKRGASGELRWQNWERYSTRQGRRNKYLGVIGQVRYEGEIGPYLPLLRLGEVMHVGKHTTFGMGRFALERG